LGLETYVPHNNPCYPTLPLEASTKNLFNLFKSYSQPRPPPVGGSASLQTVRLFAPWYPTRHAIFWLVWRRRRIKKQRVQTADFNYPLPADLIAQYPTTRRDESRLLVLDRATGAVGHRRFADLSDLLRSGDLLVLNDSKVIPARLHGDNKRTGGEFEILLVEEVSTNDWWAMLKPGKRARPQTTLQLRDRSGRLTGTEAEVVEVNEEGHRRLRFTGTLDIAQDLAEIGEVPLPPYIRRSGRVSSAVDVERYQTVYAVDPGSVAAPTAGLHFTREVLERLRRGGVEICSVTLHVGLGTFAPVKASQLEEHRVHEERFFIGPTSAEAVRRARREGHRVVAVGTTSLRAVESAASSAGILEPVPAGRTRLFIRPPHTFRAVDTLLTNFHLPCSTLLMLVSAFAAPGETRGRDLIFAAYAEAIRERYRFFSYGDAMLIL